MNVRAHFLAQILALVAAAAGCQQRDAPAAPAISSATNTPAPARAPTIVFLGDSLTAGLGLAEQEALPARIQRRLDEQGRGYRVINAGRSGDTTAGGLARVDWYFKDEVDLRALVIGLGSNDAMRGLPLTAIEDNLRQIVRKTRTHKPAAKVFLWELETFPNMGKPYADAYRALFARVAQSEGAVLIPFPLERVAGRAELNQEDGIHPNARGTEIMADQIWTTLAAHL